jgi:hypothetical protein
MKGRALQLFRDFQGRMTGDGQAFGVCRLILLARVVPERLTPELDDPDLERRLERAIATVLGTGALRDRV